MHGEESIFIEDESAIGFIKPYLESDYAFVELLTNKGITADSYIASLRGEKLTKILGSKRNATVQTAIPKFESEFAFDISTPLKKMGMPLALDAVNADFSAIGNSKAGNIYIDKAIQKIYILVAEKGTKAGLQRLSIIKIFFALPEEEIKEVYLNRPFIYMIIDTNTNIPLFMGIMNNI